MGRKVLTPTKAERVRVALAVSIGMSVAELANVLGVSKSTVERTFAPEIATGRNVKRLENALRLDRAAGKGNVSAMKALAVMMEKPPEPDAADDDSRWAHLVAPDVTQNRDFH
jgi:IS30 family transposase